MAEILGIKFIYGLAAALLGGGGLLGLVFLIIKKTINSAFAQSDKLNEKMATHNHLLVASFDKSTDRMLQGMGRVRDEVGSVRKEIVDIRGELTKHLLDHKEAWHQIDRRLDNNEILSNELVHQVNNLKRNMEGQLSSGNGKAHLTLHMEQSTEKEDKNE